MYHVTLNGQGYLIDLDAYVRRSFDPFAGKTASGARSYGDLRGPEQVLRVSDWSGGEGYPVHDVANPSRFREAYGLDGYSEPGALKLGPEVVDPIGSFGQNETCALCVFNGQLIIGASNGFVWRYDGTTLTFMGGITAVGVRAMEPFLNKLYLSGVGGAVGEITTAWALTATKFTAVAATAIYSLKTFYRQSLQYLYVLAAGAGVNGLAADYWYDGAALSVKQYDFEQAYVFSSAVLGNRLYFFAVDYPAGRLSVYSVDDSGSGGVYRHHVVMEGVYCWDSCVFDGKVYLACSPNGQIISWDGTRLERVRLAGVLGATYPYELRGMAVWNGALWIGAQDATGLQLLRFDGNAWSRPAYAITGDAPRKLAVYGGQLYLGTFRTGIGTMYRTTANSRASGYLDSGLFDASVPSITKVARSATLLHAALLASQSIQLQYRLDGSSGAWSTLGTSSTVGATSATFSFPASTTWKSIQWRVTLSGPGTSTPALYELLIRYALQPAVVREWELAIILEGTAELPMIRLDGSAEPLTGVQLSAALWSAKAATGPLAFVDVDGATRSVWLEDVKEEVAKLTQRKGYQTVAKVRLVEAA